MNKSDQPATRHCNVLPMLLISFQFRNRAGSISWQIQCLDFHTIKHSERGTGLDSGPRQKFYFPHTFEADSWTNIAFCRTNSFNNLVDCLRTGPKPFPRGALHIVRCRASSFRYEYPLISLSSSSNFLRLLPRLTVTSNPPFI
jgi:hypothetical protein